jgi:hypothetical protein
MKKIGFFLLLFSIVNNVFATITKISGGSQITNKTSSTTATITYDISLAAGKLVILVVNSDNVGTTDGDLGDHASVSDGTGNIFLKTAQFTNGQGNNGAGVTTSIWFCVLKNAVTGNSTSITVSFSANVTAKTLMTGYYNIAAGNTIAIAGIANAVIDNNKPGSLSISGLTSREYLFIRSSAVESAAAATLSGSTGYTALNSANVLRGWAGTSGQGSASNIWGLAEQRIFIGTGSTTNPTNTFSSADCVDLMVALYEIPIPPRRITIIN